MSVVDPRGVKHRLLSLEEMRDNKDSSNNNDKLNIRCQTGFSVLGVL